MSENGMQYCPNCHLRVLDSQITCCEWCGHTNCELCHDDHYCIRHNDPDAPRCVTDDETGGLDEAAN